MAVPGPRAPRVRSSRHLRTVGRGSQRGEQRPPAEAVVRLDRACKFLPIACCKAKEGGDQHPSRARRRDQVPRHLGDAAGAAALTDRHLHDAHPRGGGSHLHFQVPAERFLAHAESLERVPPDGAKRRHIREARPVAQAGSEIPRGARQGSEPAPGCPGSRGPRRREPSTKSACVLLDGRENGRDHLGPVAAVAVDEEDDIGGRGRWRQCPTAGPGRSRDAARRRRERPQQTPARRCGPSIRHRPRSPRPHRARARAATHGADRRLLVEAGDDDGDARAVESSFRARTRHQATGSSAARSLRRTSAARRTAAPRGNPGRSRPFQISRSVCCVASPSV